MDPRAAQVDRDPLDVDRVGPAADPIATLDDDDVNAGAVERSRGCETRDPRADDDDRANLCTFPDRHGRDARHGSFAGTRASTAPGIIHIAVYIGGEEYEGNPADIELDDQSVIAVVIGTPPDRIPARADFSQA